MPGEPPFVAEEDGLSSDFDSPPLANSGAKRVKLIAPKCLHGFGVENRDG